MPGGRPPKLTPEVNQKICRAVAAGNYQEVAAGWAGVSVRTLREWLRRGRREKEGIYQEFLQGVLAAEREAEITAVAAIRKQGGKDAKYFQWWLERKFPERWGSQRREIAELRKDIAELRRAIGADDHPPPPP